MSLRELQPSNAEFPTVTRPLVVGKKTYANEVSPLKADSAIVWRIHTS